jgi:hypothetical protein
MCIHPENPQAMMAPIVLNLDRRRAVQFSTAMFERYRKVTGFDISDLEARIDEAGGKWENIALLYAPLLWSGLSDDERDAIEPSELVPFITMETLLSLQAQAGRNQARQHLADRN